MDCAECARHVKEALESVPGVRTADVLLSAEQAVIEVEPGAVMPAEIREAVDRAGYTVPPDFGSPTGRTPRPTPEAPPGTRRVLSVLGLAVGIVLLVVVVGEVFGAFEVLTSRIPFAAGALIVLFVGWPAFVQVIRAALRRQVVAHTLMSLGVVAALAVGQWPTAAVVALFMRFGDWVERFTTDRGRGALRELAAMAPGVARVLRDGVEVQVEAASLEPGDLVLVRPGEMIPADGSVVEGRAAVNQAAVTGESMPVDAEPGVHVFAASLVAGGALRVRVERVGEDSTFGKVVRMVEAAESNRADVERVADKFSARYLPVVVGIALLTLLIRRDPLATAAVLVVACSCAFALATPIAVLASVGSAARRGLLVKGGKYLEALDRTDVVLVDKTGTLTLGEPVVTDVIPFEDLGEAEVLSLAAAVEIGSEHPLARAIVKAASGSAIPETDPESFEALAGLGVRGRVRGSLVELGHPRFLDPGSHRDVIDRLEGVGRTVVVIARDGRPVGALGLADTVRPEVPAAIQALTDLGIGRIELLTGDAEPVAAAVAGSLGIPYRAELLPEDKIEVVRQYQARGKRVVMIGDGVNDAPALAQADVGIAMGAAGTDVAMEAAHVALMRDDWSLVPEVFRISQRTMGVIRLNLGFTAAYNAVGLTLAALGILPPILAAAAQSLPDIGILGNSARLLRTPKP